MPNVIDLFIKERRTERRPRTLIVEDVPEVRQFWAEILQSSCDICYASTTTEAIAQISDNEFPDILVLDWILLNGTANSVLNLWMSKNGGPCCIVSGNVNEEDEINFYRRGVLHVLKKPVHAGIFSSVLQLYIKMVKSKMNYENICLEIERLKRQQIILVLAIIIAVGGGELLRAILPLL